MQSKHSLPTLLTMVLFALTVITSAQAPDVTPIKPAGYTTANKSYVRSWDVKVPLTDPTTLTLTTDPQQAIIATSYVDGLGRPLQTVVKKGSMASGTPAIDLVSPVDYDPFGREVRKYLPFAATTSDGLIKTNPFDQQTAFYSDATNPTNPLKGQGESWFYGRTNFEASPLNRPIEIFAPGNSWVGTNANADPAQRRSVKLSYVVNTDDDAVRIWNVQDGSTGAFGSYSTPSVDGTYPAGQLYKTITEDEGGKQVIEFRDKDSRVILKKVQL